MKKKYLIFIIAILAGHFAFSQDEYKTRKSRDSISDKHAQTIYYLIQESWKANKEPSYASFMPFTTSIGERRIPLRQGEGLNNDLDLLEANLDLRFPLFLGKKRGSGFKRSQRITFDYNGTFRMTLDDSKPIIPGSHKVGFSWFVSLFNNYNGWIRPQNDPQAEELISSQTKNFKFLNLLVRVHHYSNGQAPGFRYTPNENMPSEFRNSYLNGDFSTNYAYFEFSGGVYGKNVPTLHQISLGYRRDLGADDSTFAFTIDQEKSYGKDRLMLKYDFRTKRSRKNLEYHARLEFEHILGNLDAFRPNLINSNRKFRSALRVLLELAPKKNRSLGYFISGNYGRDYLNIRYDDIVYSVKAGITLELDKFYMPDLR